MRSIALIRSTMILMKKSYLTHSIAVFLVAFVVSLTWSYFARHMYSYNMDFPVIFGINSYPLICWTLALTAGCLLVDYLLKRLRITRFSLRLIGTISFYFIAVIIAETVGYHVFGVKDTSTAQYPGLPLCDCLHAPRWMQFAYFALGPLHWAITQALPWTRQK